MLNSRIAILSDYISPSFDLRESDIDMIVIHATNMNEKESLARLCDAESKVSCHYVITDNGTIYQLVEDEYRAWHAGQSYWRGREALNNYAIGIELVNPNHLLPENKFSDLQMEALINLCKHLIKKFNIKPINIVAHSDIAPSRKDDPGQYFDWRLLAKNGIGLYPNITFENKKTLCKPGDKGKLVLEAKELLAKFGYKVTISEVFDQEMADTIIAFKRRFIQSDLTPTFDSLCREVLLGLFSIC